MLRGVGQYLYVTLPLAGNVRQFDGSGLLAEQTERKLLRIVVDSLGLNLDQRPKASATVSQPLGRTCFHVGFSIRPGPALSWLECHPFPPKGCGFDSGQETCPGCGFDAQSGRVQEAT